MEHILVCPFDEKLLAKLKHKAIVVKTNDFNIIRYIDREVNQFNKLHAIKIETDILLSSIDFQEDWNNIPLAIYSPEFGKYQDFLHQLNMVRRLNIRIFLSSKSHFNFTGLKILSSLKINCGLYFDEGAYNWDLVNDLMSYAIYIKTQHAPIEPFNWLASHYSPTEYAEYSRVYFNNPAYYIHINSKEQIALTEQDMQKGNYIGEGINSLENITENKKYQEYLNSRYDTMLKLEECAFCPAFRICQAKFAGIPDKHQTCEAFFMDFMEAADYYLLKNKNFKNELWQL